ncbi:ABC transporter permease subunit [Egibacter rhizosphaerae]|uniref:ABC transporter permease subunit n=1 Tax=Egibacter rhizosphaerae TaxID=1670831 RepID=A0A411YDK9_9ACTN|nr:ABC transporter permease subunit [Egibacter rhizosphaerae]QBI19319.1 ABC transporter permease subunit [Egibacter rhizosphaerae]
MTTPASSQQAPARGARPRKPPPTPFAIGGMIGLVAFTLVTAWDWTFGIGFNPLEIPGEFRDSNPQMVEGLFNITDAEWRAEYAARLSAAFIDPESPLLISFDSRIGRGLLETIHIAVIATILGSAISLPLCIANSKVGAPNPVARVVIKLLNNANRAIPDIIWASVFVVLVSVGALPGILALTMFTIGVVVKLTSDTVDGIDMGPVEAAHAVGASHPNAMRVAVVPQVLPAYAAFSLYAFELNLRGAVILGFVGAGGIGEAFNYYWSRLEFEGVSVVVFVFLVVVIAIERISIGVRRRLI